NKKVSKMTELQEYLFNSKRPGDKVTITYLRNKQKKTATVTLKNTQGNTSVVKTHDLDVLGATFRPINDSEKKQLEINYGLKVMTVNSGAFKKANVPNGVILQTANDRPLKTIDDLQEAVKVASTSKDPVLYIKGMYPTGKRTYFVVILQD
ncbi:MAG: PDZ domain-containing protein, partial [Prevotella sp.]|nr:PDZ domain-containing protein [Prevotella sp.]